MQNSLFSPKGIPGKSEEKLYKETISKKSKYLSKKSSTPVHDNNEKNQVKYNSRLAETIQGLGEYKVLIYT